MPAAAAPTIDDYPLLTPRHVDNLTEATRVLARNVAQLVEIEKRKIAATKESTETAKLATETTKAAIEMMKAQTAVTKDLVKLLKGRGDDEPTPVPSGRKRT